MERQQQERKVKCAVWDLDNTLWSGTLAEGDDVQLKPEVLEVVRVLDERGILQSVASKNDSALALGRLRELEASKYFLHPQIHWSPKSKSIDSIAKALNIGIDTLAFIDDQPFELEEVQFVHPDVICVPANEVSTLLQRPEFMPRFVTDEARNRRGMYISDIERKQAEESFEGPKEEFLCGLGMALRIRRAEETDLWRAEELTVRTHQLNSTGYTYSYQELDQFRQSPGHMLLVASLDDKYGSYGTIGLALLETGSTAWTIKLLLMSCRVMSRGVGGVLLQHIRNLARAAGARLLAQFVHTDVNRQMYMTYKFAGFRECPGTEQGVLLEDDPGNVQPFPSYVTVQTSPD